MDVRLIDLYPFIGKLVWITAWGGDDNDSNEKTPVLRFIHEENSLGNVWPIEIRGKDALVRLRDLLNEELPACRPEDMEVL